MTHYSAEDIRKQAVDIGGGFTIAGVELQRGDTTWNPASTKGPLYGPSLVEYVMHYSGIQVHEFDLNDRCTWQGAECAPRVPGTTRCAEHALARYAKVSTKV